MSAIDIPAISLWQPYASLIACGAKRYETRHWTAPPWVIGQRVAIHAAKRKPKRHEVKSMGDLAKTPLGENWPVKVPYGAVLCIATLAWSHIVRDRFDEPHGIDVVLGNMVGSSIRDDGLGDYSIGRYVWGLKDVECLNEPVPAVGRQSWWTWNGAQR